jgi:hypothetical protein
VESDYFVTEDIVSWCDVRWDCDSPGVVVGNQGISGPITWDGGVVKKSNSINLEKFQCGLVDSLAIAVAVCEIICLGY